VITVITSAPLPAATGQESSFPVAERSCPVLRNDWVNARYKRLVLEADAPLTGAQAGEFFNLLCPQHGEDKPFLRRPMSVYAARPREGCIEFLYKVTGPGTRSLAGLRPGDALNVVGPLGRGFTLDPVWRRVLVLARGVGLATMAPLVPLAGSRGTAMSAVLSARAPEDLMREEFMQGSGIEVHAVFDSDGSSALERVEPLLRRLIEAQRPDMLYTCGSARLLALAQRLCREYGLRGEAALEQQMACAFGVCLCCVREFEVAGERVHRRVCCEGPVFDLGQVAADSPW
jgi:dihydroorotate dehydrogenase electron transfer subunit